MARPGLTINYKPETKEFRITTKDGSRAVKEARAYYTQDKQDAIGTALLMKSEGYFIG